MGKSAQPDVVESSFYELQDVIGSRQELACSPTMRAFSVDGAVSKRVTSRLQDKDDGEEFLDSHFPHWTLRSTKLRDVFLDHLTCVRTQSVGSPEVKINRW